MRTVINSKEDYNFGTMLSEGAFNALSGALSVSGGYLVGIAGFRADYAFKMLGRKTDIFIRPIIQNYYTFGIKLGLSYMKKGLIYG